MVVYVSECMISRNCELDIFARVHALYAAIENFFTELFSLVWKIFIGGMIVVVSIGLYQ